MCGIVDNRSIPTASHRRDSVVFVPVLGTVAVWAPPSLKHPRPDQSYWNCTYRQKCQSHRNTASYVNSKSTVKETDRIKKRETMGRGKHRPAGHLQQPGCFIDHPVSERCTALLTKSASVVEFRLTRDTWNGHHSLTRLSTTGRKILNALILMPTPPPDDNQTARAPSPRRGNDNLPAREPAERSVRWLLWCVAILVAAAVVRFYASLDDFWLDEIWSWAFAGQLSSAWDILTKLRHDNNHYLNTWLIYEIGPNAYPVMYRLPAVAAGVGMVLLSGLIASRRGRLAAFTAMLLIAGSYLMIHYTSEARGYAWGMFFSLLSLFLMQRSLEKNRPGTDLAFGLSAIGGFLGHLTYLDCYLPLAIWSVGHDWRNRVPTGRLLARLLRRHAAPVLFLLWLYRVNLQQMALGGGGTANAIDVILSTLSLTVGGPEFGPLTVVVGLVTAAVLLTCLAASPGRGSIPRGVYLGVIVLVPGALLIVTGRGVLYPRYFLVPSLFALLLFADRLSRLAQRGRNGKAVYGLVLIGLLASNAVQTARLIRLGRGGYQAALRLMAEQTRGPTLTVGSDHDFRNGLVIEFYRMHMPDLFDPRLPNTKRLLYFPLNRWPPEGPEWFLRHSQEPDPHPRQTITDRVGNHYELIRIFPYAGLSGWNWMLYHNRNRPMPPPATTETRTFRQS